MHVSSVRHAGSSDHRGSPWSSPEDPELEPRGSQGGSRSPRPTRLGDHRCIDRSLLSLTDLPDPSADHPLLAGAAVATARAFGLPVLAVRAAYVATTFAEALVSDDFDAARELVCSSTPDPERQGTFPFEDAEVIGAPSSEVPPDTFIVSTADLYVPFSATENAEEVEGSVRTGEEAVDADPDEDRDLHGRAIR